MNHKDKETLGSAECFEHTFDIKNNQVCFANIKGMEGGMGLSMEKGKLYAYIWDGEQEDPVTKVEIKF